MNALKSVFQNLSVRQRTILFYCSIISIVFFAFLPSLFCEFVNFDDDWMLTNNHLVRKLSLEHITGRIFGEVYRGVYQPLVFLSFAIEHYFFQWNPFYFHLHNVILHIFNTLLVFTFIQQLSGKKEVAVVASLFWALSPLRVESVTWVTERKDLLYAFFYLLALIKYVQYIKSGYHKKHLLFSLLFFALSFLSKLTAVSLSFIVVLLDYYYQRKLSFRVAIEKLLFFSISIAGGLFSVWAVMGKENDQPTSFIFSAWERAQLVSNSLIKYIIKPVIPFNLAPFHPYEYLPGHLPGYYLIFLFIAASIIITTLWIFIKYRNRKLIFGISFFAAALVFALQILPVGDAAFADRNIYISSIGLSFLAGELFFYLINNNRNKQFVIIGFLSVLLVYGVITFFQTRLWKDSITLFTDYIEKYPESELGYINRGAAKFVKKDYLGSIEDYEIVLRKDPGNYTTILNRAISRQELGDIEGAQKDFSIAIKLKPDKGKAYFSRGLSYYNMKRFPESLDDLKIALEKVQGTPFEISITLTHIARARIAALNLDSTYLDSAINELNLALNIIPDNSDASYLRGLCRYSKKEYDFAIEDFLFALKHDEKHAKAYYYLALSQAAKNNLNDACTNLGKASRLDSKEAQKMFLFYCSNSEAKEKIFYPNGNFKFRIIEGLDEKKDSIFLLCDYDSSGILLKQGVFDLQSQKYNGEIRWYYPDGTLKKTGFSKDTVTYGGWKEYYPTGSLKAEYFFSDGQMDGSYRHFYPNGRLWTERVYQKGRLLKIISCNDDMGIPLKTGSFFNGNGSLNVFDENGKIIMVQQYRNGQRIQ